MRRLILRLVLLMVALPEQLDAAQPTADSVKVAWRHVRTLPPYQAAYTRYVWISDATPEEKKRTWAAVAGLINALSLSQRVVSPALVLDDGTVKIFTDMKGDEEWGRLVLMVVNLLDYGQSTEQWDKLGDPRLEPLYHVYTVVPYPAGTNADGSHYRAGEEKVRAMAPWLIQPLGLPKDGPAREYYEAQYVYRLAELVRLTGYSQAPIVEGRNFVWQTAIDFDRGSKVVDGKVVDQSRSVGYYSWLRVKDQKTFDKLVRRQDGLSLMRDAVAKSGVSKEARFIEREGRGDGYWRTLDQVNQQAQGNRNPLLIENNDAKVFRFDAQEIYGRLDNDFWAKGLFSDKGEIQQSAPDGVGYNHQSVTNDGKIHVNLSCDWCHDKKEGNGGIMPFKPFYRNKYATPGPLALSSFRIKELKRFSDILLTPMDARGNADRLAYAAAMGQANGLTPAQYSKALVETFLAWDEHRGIDAVAREHGITAEQMVKGLQASLLKNGTLDSVNDNWLLPDARQTDIPVAAFSETYNLLELSLRGLPSWPVEVKQQLRPWLKQEKPR